MSQSVRHKKTQQEREEGAAECAHPCGLKSDVSQEHREVNEECWEDCLRPRRGGICHADEGHSEGDRVNGLKSSSLENE